MSLKENQVSAWALVRGWRDGHGRGAAGVVESPGGGCLRPGSRGESRLETVGPQCPPVLLCWDLRLVANTSRGLN